MRPILNGMMQTTFGKWLKSERRRRAITQADIEQQAGVSVSHVSKMENGHIGMPEPETRARIHKALGTSEDDLVDLGLLERIESPVPGGEPVYIPADSITPGERAAAEAHRIHEGGAPYDAPGQHQGLRAHLDAYNLTERQIEALLAVLDAFMDEP